MTLRSRFRLIAVLAGTAGLAGLSLGCQRGVNGPSLSAAVQNVTLQPTVAGLEGGANVCCCHLAGELTNMSSVPVDAELLFPAKTSDGQSVGTAIDSESEVPAGATRSFLAVGITTACKNLSLNQILADKTIRLKGLWKP